MKFKKMSMFVVIALLMMCSFVLGVHAAGTSEPITAYMRYDVDVKYNGESVVMKNVNGVRVYPISYEGSMYVPIRAISNLFGVPVEWDGATKSVVMGTSAQSQGIDLIENFKPYSVNYGTKQIQKSEKQTKSIGGLEATHWLSLKNGVPSSQAQADAYAYYNLGGKYDTLTFEASCDENTVLYVYGDNESILGKVMITGNQVPQKATISLQKTTQLHFQAKLSKNTLNNDDHTLGIVNAYLT